MVSPVFLHWAFLFKCNSVANLCTRLRRFILTVIKDRCIFEVSKTKYHDH